MGELLAVGALQTVAAVDRIVINGVKTLGRHDDVAHAKNAGVIMPQRSGVGNWDHQKYPQNKKEDLASYQSPHFS